MPAIVCDPKDRSTVELFDHVAEDYYRQYSAHTPEGFALRARREKVLSLFDKPEGKVLDVGCGPGVLAQDMRERGCTYWGIDISTRMLDVARSHFDKDDRVHFLHGDAMRLDFPSCFFDAVLCLGVIDMLRDPRQAMREIIRVLKPGGTLIISLPNLTSPYAWWRVYVFYPAVSMWYRVRRRYSSSGLRTPDPQSRRRTLFSARAARELLVSNGATLTNTVGHYYNIFLSPLDVICPGCALWLTERLEKCRWPKPQWLAAAWILKARKL